MSSSHGVSDPIVWNLKVFRHREEFYCNTLCFQSDILVFSDSRAGKEAWRDEIEKGSLRSSRENTDDQYSRKL